MSESVVVGVRVRPFNEREKDLNAELCIEMDGPTTIIKNLKAGEDSAQCFTFDESFWSHDGFEDDGKGYFRPKPGSIYADQEKVFNSFGKRVLDNAWEGFHCCLFAYGQTGSGKSYSMVGYGNNKGVVPISCEEIFTRVGEGTNETTRFEVVVSVIEIYNECVQDLLINTDDRPKKGLDIRESKMLGIYIDGVTKRPVDSYHAIEKTVDEATENRTLGATQMNATSSRAHTVLTIEFKQVEIVAGKDTTKLSMINLVDLAGSEKAGQTGAIGDRLKEGAAINKSLSALGNVIDKLVEKSRGKKNVLIPYRDSKLTRLLQNALGGSSKTIMICALSPASSNYEETLSTLRYADRAKKIQNRAVVNENPQERLMRELREENVKLREMMAGMAENLDAVAFNEKVQEIKAAEDALKEQQKSFEEKLKEVQEVQNTRASQAGRSFRGNIMSLAKDVPHIVNLNEDMLLTGRIRTYFPEGKTIRIGQVGHSLQEEDEAASSSDEKARTEEPREEDAGEPDAQIAGEGVYCNHANITNVDHQCTLRSKGRAADATFVNGVSVAVLLKQREMTQQRETDNIMDGIPLAHGDRVAFGQSCLFLFVDPLIGMAEMLIMSGQATYASARKELAKNQWKSAGLKFMRSIEVSKLWGHQELSAKIARRISHHSIMAPTLHTEDDDDLNESESETDEVQTTLSTSNQLTRRLRREINTKNRELEEKNREIARLRHLLMKSENARAAIQPVSSQDVLDLPPTPSGGDRNNMWPWASKACMKKTDLRAEIMATFDKAIEAVEQVEMDFTTKT